MSKKQEPHNEKRYTLKPLTTKEALAKALKPKPIKKATKKPKSR